MDNNGKKIKIYGGKDKIVIKPLYLNTNGKPMNEDEINRIKNLSENYINKNKPTINYENRQ